MSFKFEFHSPSNKLYEVTINADDSGSARQAGQFSQGAMRRWSFPSTTSTDLDFVAGTFAKVRTGELSTTKLSYAAVLFGGATLASVLA